MILMGIDYGAKRVGIASTDESGKFALPRAVVPNTSDLVAHIVKLAREWQVERIVVGESKNLDGTANPIQEEIQMFVSNLKHAGELVEMHPEVYSSMEAERLQGANDMHDASAASLILKSYIDYHDHNR